jgi:hypothetical protein
MGSSPRQQPFDADVFVEFRPVNPFAIPDQLIMGTLSLRAVKKPRKPRQGNGKAPPIVQRDRHRVLRKGDRLRKDLTLKD